MRDRVRDAVVGVLKRHGYDLPGIADLAAGAAIEAVWHCAPKRADEIGLAGAAKDFFVADAAALLGKEEA
jgi:hypothetical protein